MKDILDKLKLLESEKPKAALLDKKFSSFRDMEQLQGDAKITTAHKPVKMGDKQKGLTGKLVGTSEAVENTVEDLVAKLGSEFKSQFIGDKTAKKDRDLANAPEDKEIGKKKPANDIHVKEEEGVEEGLGDDERRAFKRSELQHELGHESNNIQVTINGKPWKVFAGKGYADSPEEYRHLQSMKAWAAKKSAASGKKWEVYLTGSPVSESIKEGIEMDQDSASPVGSMPADTIPQVHHVTEDWGSSDWHPVMKGMWDVIDRHYAGRANPESIEDAAQNAAEFYYDDMGYDDVEEAKDRIIGMFLRRPDGIGRKQDKTPQQELEEAGVVPAPVAGAPVAPAADAGMQGQLNIKQLASVLPGLDARTLAMAMTTLKAGQEPSMAQQKALAGAFAALVKADPQSTTKAMAILKKVSAEPVAAPVAAKPALGTKPAPAPTAPVGAPAAAPAESMDYIKENKRKR